MQSTYDYFFQEKPGWFEKEFGFKESSYSFNEVRDQFDWDDKNFILHSKHNNRKFSVGKFEMASIKELQERYEALLLKSQTLPKDLKSPSLPKDLKSPSLPNDLKSPSLPNDLKSPTLLKEGSKLKDPLKYHEIVSSVEHLIKDEKNAGAVFQVASQFNCLEMTGPSITPDQGITGYEWDHTQGPACALSCPAATLYRNYFLGLDPSLNETNQVNLLENVENLLENKGNQYWYIRNGYCKAAVNFGKLRPYLEENKGIHAKIVEELKIGIHWETEVSSEKKHRVCQVFCSALPISYNRQRDEEWEIFAKLVLEGYYKGCLLVGAISALERNKEKVKVFLTMLGGGAFGNPKKWIDEAIGKSLGVVDGNLVEVVIVRF